MKSNIKIASGAIFIASNTERMLLNLRAPNKSYGLHWCLWGGMVNQGESPYSGLIREITEEIGFMPPVEKINPFDIYQSEDGSFKYYSFICVVDNEFCPAINHEAVGYCWTKLGIWPSPMHAGAKETLCNEHSLEKLKKILEIYRQSNTVI